MHSVHSNSHDISNRAGSGDSNTNRAKTQQRFLVVSLFCHYCLSPDLHCVVFDSSCNSKTMADIRGNFTSKHQSEGDDHGASCTSCLITAKALKDVNRDWSRETKQVRKWKNREGEQEVGGEMREEWEKLLTRPSKFVFQFCVWFEVSI